MTIDDALRSLAAESGALVTVASVSGSTPRGAGSRMLVRRDGTSVGTVGGGLPEARAREAALACMAGDPRAVLRVDMRGSDAAGIELICGVVAEMWIEALPDGPRSPYALVAAAVDRGESLVIASSAREGCVAVLGAGGVALAGRAEGLDEGAVSRARESGIPLVSELDGLLYAPVEPQDRLLILGGGHVGLALARAATALSFTVRVADPRAEFSDPARFPEGVECRRASFAEAIADFPFGPTAYVVIVSPGHLGDLECARAVLGKTYRYAGLIGSRRKCRMLIEELVSEGFPREKAEALRAPIGLDIGAETPEEIAVAIAAELIAVRKNSSSLAWIDEDRKRRRATH
jgi:xanthine dehydrogenase accessory factor